MLPLTLMLLPPCFNLYCLTSSPPQKKFTKQSKEAKVTGSIQIPICISGGISPAHSSLCMDNTTHLIETPIVGSLWLFATNKEAEDALKKYETTEFIISVCGYPKRSVNCFHVEVYFVAPSQEFAPQLSALGAT